MPLLLITLNDFCEHHQTVKQVDARGGWKYVISRQVYSCNLVCVIDCGIHSYNIYIVCTQFLTSSCATASP